jgi:putative intracellular protease/amidase
MGGLRILPDVELAAVRPRDVDLLLLPGGDMWESDAYPRAELESLIAELLASSTPIAAICAGTLALGRAGALNDRRHTSNMRAYLPAHASEYTGASRYVEAPAVRDGHVITASGLAAVDFAREILAELGVLDESEGSVWFDMFKHGIIPDSEE